MMGHKGFKTDAEYRAYMEEMAEVCKPENIRKRILDDFCAETDEFISEWRSMRSRAAKALEMQEVERAVRSLDSDYVEILKYALYDFISCTDGVKDKDLVEQARFMYRIVHDLGYTDEV